MWTRTQSIVLAGVLIRSLAPWLVIIILLAVSGKFVVSGPDSNVLMNNTISRYTYPQFFIPKTKKKHALCASFFS